MLLLLSLACGDKDTGDSAGTPTFSEVDADVLVLSCGLGSTCHEGGAGGLELDGDGDYEALVDVASVDAEGEILVIPGDSANSYLMKKLESADGIEGDPMPPPSGGFDEAKIQLIADWIDAGALND
ncbi:MAG: hypothetical protein GY913_34095 [Proteobacteria bacterium]|nr:hypothetical protein [Pseudomonadota bacterium]MCP4921961.1 hypothetical protein [Pseudomonadota bacterium]